MDVLAERVRLSDMYVQYYSKFNLQPPTQEYSDFIAELRTLMDDLVTAGVDAIMISSVCKAPFIKASAFPA